MVVGYVDLPWNFHEGSWIKQDEAMFCTYTGSQRKLISEKKI